MFYTTIARPRAIAAVTLLTLTLSLLAAGSVQAQFLPAVFYGTGLQPNQTVVALINGQPCAETTTNEKGEWMLQIPSGADCGPTNGLAVTFTVDGIAMTATPAATWESGGIPVGSILTGYTLTPDGTAPPADGGDAAQGQDGEDDGGSSVLLLIGAGVVVLVAAAAGGFYLYRRNAS